MAALFVKSISLSAESFAGASNFPSNAMTSDMGRVKNATKILYLSIFGRAPTVKQLPVRCVTKRASLSSSKVVATSNVVQATLAVKKTLGASLCKTEFRFCGIES